MYGGRAIIRFPCNGDYCVSVRASSQIRNCGASGSRKLRGLRVNNTGRVIIRRR